MIVEGTLRLDLSASAPWRYRGGFFFPSGRFATLQARVVEESGSKYFELRMGLQPGLTTAEIEAALIEGERQNAQRAQREIDARGDDDLPF